MSASSASQARLRVHHPALVPLDPIAWPAPLHGFARVTWLLQNEERRSALDRVILSRTCLGSGASMHAFQGVALLKQPGEGVPIVLLSGKGAADPEVHRRFAEVDSVHAGWSSPGDILRIMRYAGVVDLLGRKALVVSPASGTAWANDHRLVPWPETLVVAGELLRYMDTLHGAGIHDSDICPANLVVEHGLRGGEIRVTKIDHGAIRSFAWFTETSVFHAHRAFAFVEEYRSLIGRAPVERMRSRLEFCSLYAIGALLLWSLTGRPPAHGVDPKLSIRRADLALPGDVAEAMGEWISAALGRTNDWVTFEEMSQRLRKLARRSLIDHGPSGQVNLTI